jgi:hypothetical protein
LGNDWSYETIPADAAVTAVEFNAALKEADFGVEHARITDVGGRCPLIAPAFGLMSRPRAYLLGVHCFGGAMTANASQICEPTPRQLTMAPLVPSQCFTKAE